MNHRYPVLHEHNRIEQFHHRWALHQQQNSPRQQRLSLAQAKQQQLQKEIIHNILAIILLLTIFIIAVMLGYGI